jgi:trk system potassium uptake protein TrkA
MRIIICGAGRVGVGIARRLAAENNAVTMIDQSSTARRGRRAHKT